LSFIHIVVKTVNKILKIDSPVQDLQNYKLKILNYLKITKSENYGLSTFSCRSGLIGVHYIYMYFKGKLGSPFFHRYVRANWVLPSFTGTLYVRANWVLPSFTGMYVRANWVLPSFTGMTGLTGFSLLLQVCQG